MEIKKVLIRTDGVKYVIIPKDSKIKQGDLVVITNNLSLVNKFRRFENGRNGKEESVRTSTNTN